MVICLLMCATAMSCKKDHTRPVSSTQWFVYGWALPCAMPPMPEGEYYLIHNDHVFRDSIYILPPIHYYTVPLPDSVYAKAKLLQDNFPTYLLNHVTDITIGGNMCAYIHLEALVNGDTIKWNINQDTSMVPKEIKQYVWQVENTLGIR